MTQTTKDYKAARAACQADANRYGKLYRLKKDFFDDWQWCMVPQIRNQFGRDREGELVEPENNEAREAARGPDDRLRWRRGLDVY